MPTENRSSNTDPRDVFIRLNPLGLGENELRKDSTGFEDQRTHSDYLLFLAGYRETHPEPLQHTEQHQGEPVAWRIPVSGSWFYDTKREACEREYADYRSAFTAEELAEEDTHAPEPLYTHADPGEVERLRAELVESDHAFIRAATELDQCESMAAMVAEHEWAEHVGTGKVSGKVEAAFTQLHNDLHEAGEKLAERDALLREIEKRHWSGVDFDLPHDLVVRIKALSASAEQEAHS